MPPFGKAGASGYAKGLSLAPLLLPPPPPPLPPPPLPAASSVPFRKAMMSEPL